MVVMEDVRTLARLLRDRRSIRDFSAREVPAELVDAILERGVLSDYRLAHAARADLCRRLEKWAEARASYERALALTRLGPERRFLERRLAELKK
jgi:RNA polymerase sigma-70 factor (ECF subfamily)